MSDIRLDIIELPGFGNFATQVVCRLCLSYSGNIVVLAFHGHECRRGYCLGPYQPALVQELSTWQKVALENLINGLKVELGSEVEHG